MKLRTAGVSELGVGSMSTRWHVQNKEAIWSNVISRVWLGLALSSFCKTRLLHNSVPMIVKILNECEAHVSL
jgi:hypothetical protein